MISNMISMDRKIRNAISDCCRISKKNFELIAVHLDQPALSRYAMLTQHTGK